MEARDGELREAEHIAKTVFGAAPHRPFRPFRPRKVSMSDMLKAVRTKGWAPLKGLGPSMTNDARADLMAMDQAGVDRKGHAQEVLQRQRRLVRDIGKVIDKRLTRGRDPEYLRLRHGRRLPERFVDLLDHDPKAFPTLRMDWAQIEDLIENARLRNPNSKTEREQVDGIVGDRLHALFGGAHCEVFTCDG
jgi:hypothetical protein